MRGSELILVLGAAALLACGGSHRETATPEPVGAADAGQEELFVATCGPQGMMGMYHASVGPYVQQHPGTAAARDEFELAAKAIEAYDYLSAAHHYLACAQQLAKVPVGHDQEQTAIRNGQVCYYNAIHSYASAGKLEAEGRAAVTEAAESDPRLASYVAEQLADPPLDCAVTPPQP